MFMEHTSCSKDSIQCRFREFACCKRWLMKTNDDDTRKYNYTVSILYSLYTTGIAVHMVHYCNKISIA